MNAQRDQVSYKMRSKCNWFEPFLFYFSGISSITFPFWLTLMASLSIKLIKRVYFFFYESLCHASQHLMLQPNKDLTFLSPKNKATVKKFCNLVSNKDHSQPRSNLYSFFIITVLYKINRPCHTINDPDLLIEDLLLTSTFCYNKPLTYMLLLFHSCSQRHAFLKFIISLSLRLVFRVQ